MCVCARVREGERGRDRQTDKVKNKQDWEKRMSKKGREEKEKVGDRERESGDHWSRNKIRNRDRERNEGERCRERMSESFS